MEKYEIEKNKKKTTPWHTIIKLLKTSAKEKIVTAAREKERKSGYGKEQFSS